MQPSYQFFTGRAPALGNIKARDSVTHQESIFWCEPLQKSESKPRVEIIPSTGREQGLPDATPYTANHALVVGA